MGFGQLRCIGTQMHLKNKFGDGFKLTLNCRCTFFQTHGILLALILTV